MLKGSLNKLIIIVLLTVVVGCNEEKQKQNHKIDLGESGMPMPSIRLQKLNSRYKMVFLNDGYPGKKLKNGEVYTHPLYGTYILKDYLYQYSVDSSKHMYSSIIKLADVAIDKMTLKDSALIFYYQPCEEFGYHETFYSSLAQSSYLIPLFNTYKLTNDVKYKDAAQKVMKSLFLPIHKGGVALKMNGVFSIEEDPTKPHGIILNGWLSALTSIKDYCELSDDTLAYNLLKQSLNTLPRVLHQYDCEEYANSRYHLKGYQKFKLSFKNTGIKVKGGYVDNKNGNKNNFVFLKNFKRKEYVNYIEETNFISENDAYKLINNEFVLNSILNRISNPVKNEVIIDIENNTSKNYVDIYRMIYTYSPDKGVTETGAWELDTTIALVSGRGKIKFEPKWENLNLIGYPTTFKQFGDEYNNVYHYIHIDRMKQLNELVNNDTIAYYINKWENYTKQWSNMETYDGMNYNPYK